MPKEAEYTTSCTSRPAQHWNSTGLWAAFHRMDEGDGGRSALWWFSVLCVKAEVFTDIIDIVMATCGCMVPMVVIFSFSWCKEELTSDWLSFDVLWIVSLSLHCCWLPVFSPPIMSALCLAFHSCLFYLFFFCYRCCVFACLIVS
jgi:hypothetical protein